MNIKSLIILLFVSCFNCNIFAQNSKKPNIIFILADDMGIGDVSALNKDAKVNTPNIDSLVFNGMSFTDAHTTSSVCTPSRYSILTGEYAWRTKLKARVLDGYSKSMIQNNKETVAKLLQRNGYKTAMIGKWHLGMNWALNKDNLEMDTKVPYSFKDKNIYKYIDFSKPFSGGPVDAGFDYFFGINASLDFPPYTFIENKNVLKIPTAIMKADGKRADFSGGKKNDLVGGQKLKRKGIKADGFEAENVMLKLTQKSVSYIHHQTKENPFFLYVSLTAPHTPVYPRDEFKNTSKAGIYGDFIHEIDWTVGQIITAIKKKGLLENTIVVFTADNGASKASFPIEFEEKYNHKPSAHLRGRKATLHQGGHTVPFIIQWKNKIKPSTKNRLNISLADFYATCAEIINVKTNNNDGVDSYSIASLLAGNHKYERTANVYTNFAGHFSIKKGDWKLDLSPKKGKSNLFNIKEDVPEKNNLFNEPVYNEKKNELINELTAIIKNGRSTKGEILKNEGSEIWQQLFWMRKKEN